MNVTGNYYETYSWLLWSHDRFIVVYCSELKIIGDYFDTSQDAQVTTLDSRSILEANCKGRKANGEYSDTHPNILTSTILHNWLLWSHDTFAVVYCRGMNVIGDTLTPVKTHRWLLWTQDQSQWSTVGGRMGMVTTVDFRWTTVVNC